jgi:ribonuclease P protein component
LISRSFSPISVLRQRAEFLAVAAYGRKWVAPGLILQIGPDSTPAGEHLRYGLTASRKVGNAVTRNRARRRLRALAIKILPLHAETGRDYVLIARMGTAKRAWSDLQQDLLTGLKKLKVAREEAV